MLSEQQAQFPLPFEWDEKSLAGRLAALTGNPVKLTITSNAVSILYARRTRAGLTLRLHRIFLNAGLEVLSEVARFAKGRKRGERLPALRSYIRKNSGLLEKERAAKPGRSRPALRTEGRFHDLSLIYQTLNAEYFGGRLDCDITWGKSARHRAVRKRTLGCYMYPKSGARGLIRINPILDSRNTPAFYVSFVVYHEMLHADIGEIKQNGRRVVHGTEFKRRERLFKDYERAVKRETRY